MQDSVRKVIENLVPKLLEDHVSRRVVTWIFWPVMAVIGYAFIATDAVFGAFVMGAPLLVVLLTYRMGLAAVPMLLLYAAGAMMAVPAYFLGKYQASDHIPMNMIAFGFVVFLVWVTVYPVYLQVLDRRWRGVSEARDRGATLRLMVTKMWLAVVVMAVVGDNFAALVCLVALLARRRSTAVAAGLACLASPVLTISLDTGIELEWSPWVLVPALLAAQPWFQAARLPWWDSRLV